MKLPIRHVHAATGPAEQDDRIDLAACLGFLLANRWLIAGVASAVCALGIAYSLVARPIYESNILIQVQDGAGSTREIIGDLSTAFDHKTDAVSEMEILRSRMVVSRAVDNTRLYIQVEPRFFPLIGAPLARRSKELSTPGLSGAGVRFGGYVWGSEAAVVSEFNVPEALEDEEFLLTAQGNGKYRLTQDNAGIDIDGVVGRTARVPTGQGLVELRVERLSARPGGQFILGRSNRLDCIENLQAALNIAEKGKLSGIIGVSLQGTDRYKTARVLDELGRIYLEQNVRRKAEEAQNSLAFLNRQLPELKRELEAAEGRYNKMRHARGTVDLGEESRNLLSMSVTAQTRLSELRQRREELLTRFQDAHPAVEAINRQMAAKESELVSLDGRIRQLPAVEQDVFRLTRDVKVNTELYTGLLNTAQQLRLITASKVGSARLLDPPEAAKKPAKPKRLMVVALSALMGLFLGVAAAFLRKRLHGRIDDPVEIEQLLGLPVAAAIPHTDSQQKLYQQLLGQGRQLSVLPHYAPGDTAIESLRGFRTSLQFSMASARNNIIMITGPTPGVGKSFVSANLATVLAAVGKKVLLIDADLRKGLLHRYFGLERGVGLAEAIAARRSVERVIHREVVENVDFISTGALPARPAELLAHRNLGKLLQLLAPRYDFVLVDTAPVLSVSDPLAVAAHAGAMFNVVRGGVSTVSEVEEAVKRLSRAGATVTGIVFNGARLRFDYGYAARYGYAFPA